MTAEKKSSLGGWDKPLRVKDEADEVIVETEIQEQGPSEINVSKKGSNLVIEGRKPHEHHDLRLPDLPEGTAEAGVRVQSSEAGLSVVVPKVPKEGDGTKDSQ
jgi:hypothetical protein